MENTSKALLIAAAVLVVIIIITIGIKVFTSSSGTEKVATDTGKTISEKTEEAGGLLDFSGWKQEADGSFSKGKITGVKVGDYVKYEDVLSDVTLTENSQIIKDIAKYSGSSMNQINSLSQWKEKWQILDIQNGKLRLISSMPMNSIYLSGADGYNNCVYLIDELCNQLYSSNKGKAQNLKIEDMEKYLSYDYTQFISKNSNIRYGETKEYTGNKMYPNIYKDEKGCVSIDGRNPNGKLGISEQKELVSGTTTATNNIVATQTSWEGSGTSNDLFHRQANGHWQTEYILSSRSVELYNGVADYRIFCVKSGYTPSIKGISLFKGYSGSGQNIAGNIRPVVTLNSNVKFSGNSTDGWTIK